MAIKADYHMHSSYSTDSEESMESMILEGIRRGFDTICFTEHMDMDFPVSEDTPEGSFLLNTDSYLYELLGLREKYASKIKINFGVELGVQPHLRKELALYAKAYDFDFIIASCHLVDHMDPYYPEYFNRYSEEEGFRRYFKEVLSGLGIFQNFDVLGHLDYIVRYPKNKDLDYSYDQYKDCIDPILEKLIDLEKGLEINTGGLHDGLREPNPCSDILKRYRELGGEIITVGSDGHNTGAMGFSFDVAQKILMDCGFKYYTTFEKRVPEFHKLG